MVERTQLSENLQDGGMLEMAMYLLVDMPAQTLSILQQSTYLILFL